MAAIRSALYFMFLAPPPLWPSWIRCWAYWWVLMVGGWWQGKTSVWLLNCRTAMLIVVFWCGVILFTELQNILLFSTSDISYQMCYCCQKLEISKFRERIGSGSESGGDPLPKSCDLSKQIRGLEIQSGSAPDPLPKLMWPVCNGKCDWFIAQMCHKSLTSCYMRNIYVYWNLWEVLMNFIKITPPAIWTLYNNSSE